MNNICSDCGGDKTMQNDSQMCICSNYDYDDFQIKQTSHSVLLNSVGMAYPACRFNCLPQIKYRCCAKLIDRNNRNTPITYFCICSLIGGDYGSPPPTAAEKHFLTPIIEQLPIFYITVKYFR